MSMHTAQLQEQLAKLSPQELQELGLRLQDRASTIGSSALETALGLPGRYNAAVTPMAESVQRGIKGVLAKGGGMGARNAIRFAGSAPVLGALKAVPLVGAAGAALGAGDIVFGNESAGNKAMDATAMTIGGILGMAGGPLGAAAGAGIGKTISDGIQFVVGGGKSAEERKMEEALKMLQTGGMY